MCSSWMFDVKQRQKIMCLLLLLLLFNTGHCQTKLVMLSTNSATPEHRSNPMSLMLIEQVFLSWCWILFLNKRIRSQKLWKRNANF
ncbi:hypothetical protein ACB092_11G045100 [Castanea dentata]